MLYTYIEIPPKPPDLCIICSIDCLRSDRYREWRRTNPHVRYSSGLDIDTVESGIMYEKNTEVTSSFILQVLIIQFLLSKAFLYKRKSYLEISLYCNLSKLKTIFTCYS